MVEDVRHLGVEQKARSTVYFPYQYSPLGRMTWVLRTASSPLGLVPEVRVAVAEVDANQPLHEVMTLGEVVDVSYWEWSFMGMLFWIFAALALLLGAIGIYGLMAHSVSECTQEVGIRMALGAQKSQVLLQVLRQGGLLIGIGMAVGLIGGVGVGKLLSSLLYNVPAFDPTVLLGVSLLLLTVALSATFFPARRAAGVDPIIALRHE